MMKQYLMGLFVLALCCSVVELLCEQGALARHIKLMSALCLLCVLVAPISSLARQEIDLPELVGRLTEQWLREQQEAEQQYEDRWQTEGERLDVALAQEMIAQMLEQRFGLLAADCRVEITTDASGTIIDHMGIMLSGQGIWTNAHEVQSYVKTTFGCEASVYIE